MADGKGLKGICSKLSGDMAACCEAEVLRQCVDIIPTMCADNYDIGSDKFIKCATYGSGVYWSEEEYKRVRNSLKNGDEHFQIYIGKFIMKSASAKTDKECAKVVKDLIGSFKAPRSIFDGAKLKSSVISAAEDRTSETIYAGLELSNGKNVACSGEPIPYIRESLENEPPEVAESQFGNLKCFTYDPNGQQKLQDAVDLSPYDIYKFGQLFFNLSKRLAEKNKNLMELIKKYTNRIRVFGDYQSLSEFLPTLNINGRCNAGEKDAAIKNANEAIELYKKVQDNKCTGLSVTAETENIGAVAGMTIASQISLVRLFGIKNDPNAVDLYLSFPNENFAYAVMDWNLLGVEPTTQQEPLK